MSVSLSALDLAPIVSGGTAREALGRTVELARLVERLGYARYWVAEHHGMPSIASSSPEILIEHVASATERIRVGSGGIMLPNHVPLQLAERFHTLEALHPGRIDLGIGRAPGTDPTTSRALHPFDAQLFPQLLAELIGFSRRDLPADHPFHSVRVIPDEVTLPPIWILGSSGASASLAGQLGMGYGFARHFSPSSPLPALEAYRESFTPSEHFPRPHVVMAVTVLCAETDEEAERLASSMALNWLRIRRGEFAPIPSPAEALAHPYTPQERAGVAHYLEQHFIGSPATVREKLGALLAETNADELMASTMAFDPAARMRSYELLAGVFAPRAG